MGTAQPGPERRVPRQRMCPTRSRTDPVTTVRIPLGTDPLPRQCCDMRAKLLAKKPL